MNKIIKSIIIAIAILATQIVANAETQYESINPNNRIIDVTNYQSNDIVDVTNLQPKITEVIYNDDNDYNKNDTSPRITEIIPQKRGNSIVPMGNIQSYIYKEEFDLDNVERTYIINNLKDLNYALTQARNHNFQNIRLKVKMGLPVDTGLGRELQIMRGVFMYPHVTGIEKNYLIMKTDFRYIYSPDVAVSPQYTKRAEAAMNRAIEESDMRFAKSDKDKIAAYVDYLYMTTSYKYTTANNYPSYSNFYSIDLNKEGVCTSYALNIQRLCDKLNIRNYRTHYNPNHTVVRAKLDGKWTTIDATAFGDKNYYRNNRSLDLLYKTTFINTRLVTDRNNMPNESVLIIPELER